jgi:glutathione S-transferase
MANPILYGPGYSTYARSARLSLEEKGVPYEHVEVDFLQGMPAEQVARHPFSKVPAFEHEGFYLYETCAIERYVDEAFEGPALQPADPKARARMSQIISILDSYVYGAMITNVLIQRLVVPAMGGESDEAVIEAALPAARNSAEVLEGFIGERNYLVGDALSLADLHLVPILTYFKLTPESGPILEDKPGLHRWAEVMAARDSVKRYCPPEIKSP